MEGPADRQARGHHLPRRRRRASGARWGESRPVTRARSTRSPAGSWWCCVGRATKMQSQMMELPKRYETVARLGARSSTGDPEGEITETGRLPPDPPPLPTGEIRQRPPIYSADQDQRRARLPQGAPRRELSDARADRDSLPLRADSGANASAAGYEIECSSGTYVRSLIADLGDAYCLELRRTAIGPFSVAQASRRRRAAAAGRILRCSSIEQALGGGRAISAMLARGCQASPPSRDVGLRREDHATARCARAGSGEWRSASFDGVHLGHREVIRGADSVLTFDPHPTSVVAPQHTPKLLTTLEVKAELVAALGVQELIVIPFDADFARTQRTGVHRRCARRHARRHVRVGG